MPLSSVFPHYKQVLLLSLFIFLHPTNSLASENILHENSIHEKKPIANAGNNLRVRSGDKVILNASKSKDPDGRITKYQWKQVQGKKVQLKTRHKPRARFIAPHTSKIINLKFKIIVTDSEGLRAQDTMLVTVFPQSELNDTGIITCGDTFDSNYLSCPINTHPNQDGDLGRDATHNDNSDGHAGFSFTKLNAQGQPLSDQSLSYTDQPWHCVRDNVTGLIWETKTTSPTDLQYAEDLYTWYEPDPSKSIYPGHANLSSNCNGYNTNDPSSFCNSHAYVERVNASQLCGKGKWRLPTKEELISLINYGSEFHSPAIDSNYFPNLVSQAYSYWSSSSAMSHTTIDNWDANAFDVHAINGTIGFQGKNELNAIRLVTETH